MPEDVIKTSPESQDPSALQTAVYSYTHPTLGAIKIPYVANVEMPSYVATVIGSAVGANKNHLTFVNTSNRIIRIRKIKVVANITAAITGAIIMISVEGLQSAFPTGGTDITPRKMNTNYENLPAGIEIKAAPAANVNIVSNYVLDIGAIGVEEAVTTNNLTLELLKKENEFSSLILNQNQGIVVKQGSVAGAGAINIKIDFTLD
jgi:hypothetical protein